MQRVMDQPNPIVAITVVSSYSCLILPIEAIKILPNMFQNSESNSNMTQMLFSTGSPPCTYWKVTKTVKYTKHENCPKKFTKGAITNTEGQCLI